MMADHDDSQSDSPQTIGGAQEPTLEDRVVAIEQALASLGDAVSPGGTRSLAPYASWRKNINTEK